MARSTSDNTRERILEVALGLFVDHGYDKTSLREIAEAIGVSKAALYYHFRTKEDILLALVDGVTAPGKAVFEELAAGPVDLARWGATIDAVVDLMFSRRRLFLLIERNRRVIEELRAVRGVDPQRHQEQIKRIVSDPSLPLGDRIRIVSSVGAIVAILGAWEALSDVTDAELRAAALDALHDLVG